MAAPYKLMRTILPAGGVAGGGGGSGSTTSPYTIGCTYDGNLPPNFYLVIVPLDQAVTFGNLMGVSQGYLESAPTSTITLSINQNGTPIGTMAFAAGAQTATFTGGSVNFNVGDVLTVVTPMSIDPTAANIGFVLSGVVAND